MIVYNATKEQFNNDVKYDLTLDKTLLIRCEKGCYIYCEDENLSKYIKVTLEISKKK